ncbi:alpha-1,3-arabinosyltransferase XAT3-like [Rosa rugosa]|uniref:alpha-1,3-arabinosyltransferase XAT3-like n=1 Tax=Rosa rugosa TaxID=74645 RepID=UPI002B4114D3|nr:alpha-1,3-arabinosyltransferase XAT3-like [Rosa rugosa]XP_062017810.1 alpha-1,3-arabinosyltransferase XAT3-like [Rosa rugosa]
MAKESNNVMLGASSIMICLLTIGLLYAALTINPFETWKHKVSNLDGKSVGGEEPLRFLFRRLVRGKDQVQLDTTGLSCHSDLHFELCLTNKPVIIDKNASTVYIPSKEAKSEYKVKPYARKEDETAMKIVTPVRILHGNITPPACDFIHRVPAVIFSSGGFTGNLFHEFNEIIIPLFLTCHHFRSRIQFVITDFKPWWVEKYSRVLSHLSSHDVINPVENGSVHCFPGAVMGLIYHENLALNYTEIPGGYSMLDFKQFLRESFMLKMKHVSEMKRQRPMLMHLSRSETRKFLNEDKIVEMMEALGFQVIVATPNQTSNLDTFSGLVNSCSVIVGAHGAGLTNAVFLPTKAVMVQVVPLGLDWASAAYYGETVGTGMGLEYLEYKIKAEESSLFDVYGPDHPVITDPESIFAKGYEAARAVYVDGQNLKINLVRFRKTLVEAMKLLGHSTSEN